MPEEVSRPNLGTPGPFMVCGLCNIVLDVFSFVENPGTKKEKEDATTREYRHPIWAKNDHEPLPVVGKPSDAGGVCDFCHKPGPNKWVYVPRKTVRLADPQNAGQLLDYSSPWGCCEECMRLVKRRNLTALLDHVFSLKTDMPRWQRRAIRPFVRKLHSEFFKSNPAGPYEIISPNDPPPMGKRGGRKGM